MSFYAYFYLRSENPATQRKFGRLTKRFERRESPLSDEEFTKTALAINPADGARALSLLGRSAKDAKLWLSGARRNKKGYFTFEFNFDWEDRNLPRALVAFFGRLDPDVDVRCYVESDELDTFYRFEDGKAVKRSHSYPFSDLAKDRRAMSKNGPYRWWNDGLPAGVWHGALGEDFEQEHADNAAYDQEQEQIAAAKDAADAESFAGSPFRAFVEKLGADEEFDAHRLIESIGAESILGRPFRAWLCADTLGDVPQFRTELPRVEIDARHADMGYYLKIELPRTVSDGKTVRHIDLDRIRAHVEQLGVSFMDSMFLESSLECCWIGDNAYVDIAVFEARARITISAPDESILQMSLRELADWYLETTGPGIHMKSNPVVARLLSEGIDANRDTVDDYFYLKYRTEYSDDPDRANAYLKQGVESDELASIYAMGMKLGNSYSKPEFLEGVRLMQLAEERGHPLAQIRLESLARTLENRIFDD